MLSGTVLLKPLEAKIVEEFEKDLESFCLITVGITQAKGKLSKNKGKFPIWEDAIALRLGNESSCLLELVYEGEDGQNQSLGDTQIDFKEVEEHGKVSKWYDIQSQGKQTGQILLEIAFSAGEFPHDNILLSEASKLAHHYHTSHASGRIRGDEDPIPEEDEK